MEAFKYQYRTNKTYQKYCQLLKKSPITVRQVSEIPFLPIEMFKEQDIMSGDWAPETTFRSSGTTGQKRSSHKVRDLSFYKELSQNIFEHQYGPVSGYKIMALLPSYQQAGDSSLVYMVDHFIQNAKKGSGFYLDEDQRLIKELTEDPESKKILIGVSYALLDLVDRYDVEAGNTIIMETGGMKGRRKELVKEELHSILQKEFEVESIHSEYGMTELLSQSYSKGKGLFSAPPSMQILIRDINDPFDYLPEQKTGGVNIVDLGNIDSCCFVETKDLGKIEVDNKIRLLGRFDHSDIRGCNLLLA